MQTDKTQITRYKIKLNGRHAENDVVAVEEPMQIDLLQEQTSQEQASREQASQEPASQEKTSQDRPLQKHSLQKDFHQTYSITMRTPGNDQYLTYGLLFSEGVISQASDIDSITSSIISSIDKEVVEDNRTESSVSKSNVTESSRSESNVFEANVMLVQIAASTVLNLDDQSRRLASHSGCGICGKTSLKALALKNPRQQRKLQLSLSCSDIVKVRDTLAKQPLFSGTGGSHVAGIVYEILIDGQFSLDFDSAKCFEDVGRHNALDKLIGCELVDNNLSKPGIVILSGRVGFELVQKVVMAGYSIIIALGAPSSLAIKAANQFGVTLIGFAKDDHYNLYTF